MIRFDEISNLAFKPFTIGMRCLEYQCGKVSQIVHTSKNFKLRIRFFRKYRTITAKLYVSLYYVSISVYIKTR